MEAKNLRIGNLVEYKITDSLDDRKEWWELNPIDVFDLQHLIEFPDDGFFRSIPLTEEWLLKFSAIVSDGRFGKFYTINFIEFHTSENGEICFCWDGFMKEIKHVHQLQNLYFALTNEELTIKN